MKILLIGEYSNLHNSLKQGLVNNGHNVVLLSNGDGFKNYEADILIKSSFFEKKFLKIKRGLSNNGLRYRMNFYPASIDEAATNKKIKP